VPKLDRVSAAGVPDFWSGRSFADFCFSASASLSPFRADALMECYTVEDMSRFIASRDSLPPALRGFVMPYSPETYVAKEARLFLTIDGRGGFALIADELASLFSLPGAGYGDLLVQAAVQEGASKLSCFDNKGKLVSLYSRHGFRETNRFAWKDDLAPRAWDYAAWGRPDYVEMSR
jgi:hypothetical protein